MLVSDLFFFLEVLGILQALPPQSLDGVFELLDVGGSIDDLLYPHLVDLLLVLVQGLFLLGDDLMQIGDVLL